MRIHETRNQHLVSKEKTKINSQPRPETADKISHASPEWLFQFQMDVW